VAAEAGYGLRREVLSPLQRLTQSISTIAPTSSPAAIAGLLWFLARGRRSKAVVRDHKPFPLEMGSRVFLNLQSLTLGPADVFIPHCRTGAYVLCQHRNALLGVEVDRPDTERPKPFQAALKIPALSDDQSSKSKLPN